MNIKETSPKTKKTAGDLGKKKGEIQVIVRAMSIMRAVQDHPLGLSLQQIADRVDLPRSTVQRIVATLQNEKLLLQATPTSRVCLGPTILNLASSVRGRIANSARPLLSELSAKLHETVDLAIIRKDRAIFVDQVVGPDRSYLVSAVGESFPLYCTANGKAYLAGLLNEEEIVSLIGKQFKALTSTTFTQIQSLLNDLRGVRHTGYAIDRGEHMPGICAVGAIMYDMLGNPLAISVPVPKKRFKEREYEIAESLVRTRNAVEQLLHAFQ